MLHAAISRWEISRGRPAEQASYRPRRLRPRRDPGGLSTLPAKKDHPDAAFVDDVVERLSAFAPASAQVSARLMFGGFGLYADGAMFGLVDDGQLYLRADEENRSDFEAAGRQPWVYEMKGKPVRMPYYPIPDDDFDDTGALRRWFESARAAARRTAAKKKRSPRGRTSRGS